MKFRIFFYCSINYLWWGVFFMREFVSLVKKEGLIVLCCSIDMLVDVYFVFLMLDGLDIILFFCFYDWIFKIFLWIVCMGVWKLVDFI